MKKNKYSRMQDFSVESGIPTQQISFNVILMLYNILKYI